MIKNSPSTEFNDTLNVLETVSVATAAAVTVQWKGPDVDDDTLTLYCTMMNWFCNVCSSNVNRRPRLSVSSTVMFTFKLCERTRQLNATESPSNSWDPVTLLKKAVSEIN